MKFEAYNTTYNIVSIIKLIWCFADFQNNNQTTFCSPFPLILNTRERIKSKKFFNERLEFIK